MIDIINKTKELESNISPVTYNETLIYTKDLPENDISKHLEPKEYITKNEISEYFIQELKKIKHLI